MADLTIPATITSPNDIRPGHVVAYGRDPNGVARPLAVNAAGGLAGSAAGGAAGDGASDLGTSTQVASQTSAITILAANAARYGASVYNDDANPLFLLLGAGTVSATVYTVKIPSEGYYEVPYGFTGILTGLWSADGAGAARVTEFT